MLKINGLYKTFISKLWKPKTPEIINILTRTSGRPKGFEKCHESILKQTCQNYKHIVSYDDVIDLDYLNKYDLKIVSVKKNDSLPDSILIDKYEPYNLYCNDLLKEVDDGWIIYLDDDDMLIDGGVLKYLHKKIEKNNKDTLFIWQTRFPDGSLLPPSKTFDDKEIKEQYIDTACFMFHSKYKDKAKWDSFLAADFRFIRDLAEVIPNQKWIKKVFTQKNNFGDGGQRNDVNM